MRAGKSTLMKIIAGLDKDFEGSVWLRDGFKVGVLEQEPELDASKDVGGCVTGRDGPRLARRGTGAPQERVRRRQAQAGPGASIQ